MDYTTATSAERPDPGGTDSLMRKQSAAPVRLQSGGRHVRIVREQRRRPAVAVNIPPTDVNSQCLPYIIIRMGFGKGQHRTDLVCSASYVWELDVVASSC